MTEFTEVVKLIRNGATNEELSEHLAELVAKTQATGKASKLQYTIEIKPAGEGKVILCDSFVAKAAEPNRESSIFYHDGRFNLSRKQPGQYSLEDLRTADS